MALTSTTTFDLVGQTQSIMFYESATLVDQVTFSSNSITFSTISSFNLSKSDTILYNTYMNVFYQLLLKNFQQIYPYAVMAWPLCEFDITISSSGVIHIDYTQTSLGNSVYFINYVPVATSAAFSARSSITVTLQEFIMTINMLNQYNTQVSLN